MVGPPSGIEGNQMQSFLGVAGLVVTLILVGITAWYSWQTQQMVREMRESRRAAIRPEIRLDLELFGAAVLARVENVGTGAAVNVSAVLRAESDGPTIAQSIEWQTPILRPGESRLLDFPLGANGHPIPFKELRDHKFRILLEGSCTDTSGETRALGDQLAVTAATRREVTVSSSDDMSSRLKSIVNELSGLRGAIEGLRTKG